VQARSLLTVAIWEALATESRGRPVARLGSSVFPGAFASDRLLVSTQTTTVLIRLALTSSRCSTSAGCRYPGLDPSGSPKSTHQTCPRRITAGPAPTPVRPPSFGVGTLLPRDHHRVARLGRSPGSMPRSDRGHDGAVPRTHAQPEPTARCASSSALGRRHRSLRTARRGEKWRSSSRSSITGNTSAPQESAAPARADGGPSRSRGGRRKTGSPAPAPRCRLPRARACRWCPHRPGGRARRREAATPSLRGQSAQQ